MWFIYLYNTYIWLYIYTYIHSFLYSSERKYISIALLYNYRYSSYKLHQNLRSLLEVSSNVEFKPYQWTFWYSVLLKSFIYLALWMEFFSPWTILHQDSLIIFKKLGRPKGIGWSGRWEGGLGWRIHVNPWLIHVNVWQKPLKYCKVISLQLIKINEEKKLVQQLIQNFQLLTIYSTIIFQITFRKYHHQSH